MIYPYLGDMLNAAGVEHFIADELWAPHAGKPALRDAWRIMPTVLVADDLRTALGTPLRVNSGYRSAAYNAEIGGAPNSLHVAWNALDLSPADGDVDALHSVALAHPLAGQMGIGRYASFVHIDTRGVIGRAAPARWRG